MTSCFHDNSSNNDCDLNDNGHARVFKHDNSLQCEQGSGIERSVMLEELTNAGIDVICAQSGYDGLAYAAVCGNATGKIHVFTIPKVNVEDAATLGFHPLSELENPHLEN